MDAPKAKRGRPPKEQEEVIESVEEITPALVEPSQIVDIKHVFRTMSSYGILDEGRAIYPREVIEDYLNQNFFAQGYSLFKVEHLRTNVGPEGDTLGEYMLYVLVKYAQ
jgi:hypothetical protein